LEEAISNETTTNIASAHVKTLSTCLDNMYEGLDLERLLYCLSKMLVVASLCPEKREKQKLVQAAKRAGAITSPPSQCSVAASTYWGNLQSFCQQKTAAPQNSNEEEDVENDDERDEEEDVEFDDERDEEEDVEFDAQLVNQKEPSMSRVKKMAKLIVQLVASKKNIPSSSWNTTLVKAFANSSFILSDHEASEVARLSCLIRKYYPRLLKKGSRNRIAIAMPFLNFYNWCCCVLDLPGKAKKVVPEPTLGKLWAIPLDKYTLHETFFNSSKGPLAIKGVTSRAVAHKDLSKLFYSMFDQKVIAKACGKNEFAFRYNLINGLI
jgi:hypothetical protein